MRKTCEFAQVTVAVAAVHVGSTFLFADKESQSTSGAPGNHLRQETVTDAAPVEGTILHAPSQMVLVRGNGAGSTSINRGSIHLRVSIHGGPPSHPLSWVV